jgi:hypothetical protein
MATDPGGAALLGANGSNRAVAANEDPQVAREESHHRAASSPPAPLSALSPDKQRSGNHNSQRPLLSPASAQPSLAMRHMRALSRSKYSKSHKSPAQQHGHNHSKHGHSSGRAAMRINTSASTFDSLAGSATTTPTSVMTSVASVGGGGGGAHVTSGGTPHTSHGTPAQVHAHQHVQRTHSAHGANNDDDEGAVSPPGGALERKVTSMSRAPGGFDAERTTAGYHPDLFVDGLIEAGMPLQPLTFAQRVFIFFEIPSTGRFAQSLSICIMLLIVLSTVAFCVETLPQYRDGRGDDTALDAFRWIESVCIVIFTIEYLSRLATAHSMPYVKPVDDDDAVDDDMYLPAAFDAAHVYSVVTGHRSRTPPSRTPPSRTPPSRTPPMSPQPLSLSPNASSSKSRTRSRTPPMARTPPLLPRSQLETVVDSASAMQLPPVVSFSTVVQTHADATTADEGAIAAPAAAAAAAAAAVAASDKSEGGDGDGAVAAPDLNHKLLMTWLFAKRLMNMVDLLAILPFYVQLAIGGGGGGLAIFRVLRLARVFRVFKLGKYSSGMQMFARVLYKSRDALYLLIFFVTIAVILFGSMIFFAEGGEYDAACDCFLRDNALGDGKEESPFLSIPASFYWVAITTTTVGYGDLYPTSVAGKLVATFTMHLGVLVLALPITVIGTHFAIEYDALEEAAAAEYAWDDDDEYGDGGGEFYNDGHEDGTFQTEYSNHQRGPSRDVHVHAHHAQHHRQPRGSADFSSVSASHERRRSASGASLPVSPMHAHHTHAHAHSHAGNPHLTVHGSGNAAPSRNLSISDFRKQKLQARKEKLFGGTSPSLNHKAARSHKSSANSHSSQSHQSSKDSSMFSVHSSSHSIGSAPVLVAAPMSGSDAHIRRSSYTHSSATTKGSTPASRTPPMTPLPRTHAPPLRSPPPPPPPPPPSSSSLSPLPLPLPLIGQALSVASVSASPEASECSPSTMLQRSQQRAPRTGSEMFGSASRTSASSNVSDSSSILDAARAAAQQRVHDVSLRARQRSHAGCHCMCFCPLNDATHRPPVSATSAANANDNDDDNDADVSFGNQLTGAEAAELAYLESLQCHVAAALVSTEHFESQSGDNADNDDTAAAAVNTDTAPAVDIRAAIAATATATAAGDGDKSDTTTSLASTATTTMTTTTTAAAVATAVLAESVQQSAPAAASGAHIHASAPKPAPPPSAAPPVARPQKLKYAVPEFFSP